MGNCQLGKGGRWANEVEMGNKEMKMGNKKGLVDGE